MRISDWSSDVCSSDLRLSACPARRRVADVSRRGGYNRAPSYFPESNGAMTALTLALSKGRILEESLPFLAKVGLDPAGDIDRLLRVPSHTPGVSLLIIRPTDVPTYVEYGAADLGIVGKDVLMENGSSELYEPLDLDIAKCRLSVAAKKDAPARDPRRRLRVATKYPEIARRHFADKGEQRSEEHTSALQSLMRISYAVFCLQKKQ